MSGVTNELVLVVTNTPLKYTTWGTRRAENMQVEKMVGQDRWRKGGGAEGGLEPRTGYQPPPPSTLIPLSGVFDQQLTTGLCDSYHEHAEVRPDLLRAGGENCSLFSMWLFLVMKTNICLHLSQTLRVSVSVFITASGYPEQFAVSCLRCGGVSSVCCFSARDLRILLWFWDLCGSWQRAADRILMTAQLVPATNKRR